MKRLLQIYSILFVAICYSQTPIYKWDFDGNMLNSGSATISSWISIGTGSVAYVPNRLGQVNSAINIPNTQGYTIDILNGVMPSGNAARTLSFWVKFANDTDNKTYPVVGWGNGVPNQAFGFWRNGVQNSYYTWGSGNDYNIPQTNVQIQSVNNGWVHVAMTHTGSTLAIYYNGVDSGNYARTLNTGNQNFTINRLVNGSLGTGDAIQLDDLRIYNTALNATQVANIYNQIITAVPTITNVSATNIGTSTATINYSVNANNAATTTEIRYAVVPGGALQTQVGPSASGTTNTNLLQNLVGLLPNTTYEYSVWAVNSQGTTFSSALTFTTGSLAAPVISSVNAATITNVSANINFNVNTNGVATPTSINYGTSPTALTISTQGPVVNSSAPSLTNIGLTGLTPNTTYYYQVVAVNSNFLILSTINSFTTLATAPAPTPIYHYKFNGNLNEENGGPALTISPLAILPYSFPNNSELLLQKDNLNRTPFFTATLPNLPQGNAARTVSIRINYESGALATENNVFSWGTPVNDQAYGFSQTASNANNFFWGPNDVTFSMPTSFGTWYTLTLVYNGSFVSIYRDGSLWQQVARNLNTNGTILSIGATPNVNSPRFLHARIDDIQIFNTALTATQITTLNNQLLSSSDFNSNAVKFNLYPNPASDIFNIEMETELKSVDIYTLQGQKVLTTSQKLVNISNLSSGIYRVSVEDENGHIGTKKILKK
jgi:hypothetical protein